MVEVKEKFNEYLNRGDLRKDEYQKEIFELYLRKARHNLAVAKLDYRISSEERVKEFLGLPKDFEEYDWAVNKAYYAMYLAAQALVAKKGYKSSSHDATITTLELLYVERGLMDHKYLEVLKKWIERLKWAKGTRKVASYYVEESITKRLAESVIKTAGEFIDKVEGILR